MLPSLGEAEQGEQVASVTPEQFEALNGEVTTLRQQMDGADAAPAVEGLATTEQFTALGQRLDGLEQSTTAGSQQASEAAAAAQQAADGAGETATAAQETATAAQEAASSAQQAADAAQETATAAQETANTANSASTAAQETATQARDTAAAAQEAAEQAGARIDGALAGFDDRLAAMEQRNRRADSALAAANLKSAIDRGGPFMGELETYAQSTEAGGSTDALREFAADGVPSVAALTAAWPTVEGRIADALRPAEPDAPVGEQLLTGLRSLVQVRPAGPAPASEPGPAAALSRLDAAITNGDLAAWQTEWEALPQPAKDASADFAEDVAARVAADRIVSETLAAAPAAAAGEGEGEATPAAEEPAATENQG
ncbi:hypothetical protein GTW51_12140 [Aurantimonas aggregata]|uniref:Phage tail protein n=1 Tax=Aurantimonas aggregata TaxID=2047720 RepID=A0A6L9MHZ3_9HYPH|nr:hypothetical protein [Aurantimonas aggregata]NDV87449.1 hypothetical protein [Aurantimonas aggregata]